MKRLSDLYDEMKGEGSYGGASSGYGGGHGGGYGYGCVYCCRKDDDDDLGLLFLAGIGALIAAGALLARLIANANANGRDFDDESWSFMDSIREAFPGKDEQKAAYNRVTLAWYNVCIII